MPLPVNWQVDGGRETHGKKESKLIKTNHIAKENVLLLPSTTTTIIIIAEKTLKQLKRNEKSQKNRKLAISFTYFSFSARKIARKKLKETPTMISRSTFRNAAQPFEKKRRSFFLYSTHQQQFKLLILFILHILFYV